MSIIFYTKQLSIQIFTAAWQDTEKDIMAQATCVALSPQEGWIFAVRRECGGPSSSNCQDICSDPTSTQYEHLMSTFQNLNVYVIISNWSIFIQ